MSQWTKLGNVAFPREQAPDHDKWWNCGELFYDFGMERAVLKLTGLHLGFALVRVFDNIERPPLLQGTLEVTIDEGRGDDAFIQKCGRISSKDGDGPTDNVQYIIHLECIPPPAGKDRRGYHFRIRSDHDENTKPARRT